MAALWEAVPCRQGREDVLKAAWFADSPSFSVHVQGVRPLVVAVVEAALAVRLPFKRMAPAPACAVPPLKINPPIMSVNPFRSRMPPLLIVFVPPTRLSV